MHKFRRKPKKKTSRILPASRFDPKFLAQYLGLAYRKEEAEWLRNYDEDIDYYKSPINLDD